MRPVTCVRGFFDRDLVGHMQSFFKYIFIPDNCVSAVKIFRNIVLSFKKISLENFF